MPKLTEQEYTSRVWSTMQKIAKLPIVREMLIQAFEHPNKRAIVEELILKNKSTDTVRENARRIHKAFVVVANRV